MLRAAADLIHVRGVHGTSVDDVLEASGTGKSQFYRYFGSKDDLVREVVHYQMEEWLKRVGAILARLDSFRGFEEWFERMVAFQSRRGFVGGCPIGSVAAETADSNEPLRLDLTEIFQVRRRYIANGLAAMKQRGELVAEADPEELAEFVLAAIQGGLLLSSTEKDGDLLRHALAHALAHLRSFATPKAALSS